MFSLSTAKEYHYWFVRQEYYWLVFDELICVFFSGTARFPCLCVSRVLCDPIRIHNDRRLLRRQE